MANSFVRTPSIALLACPICKGELEGERLGVRCRSCDRHWSKRDGYVDFLATGAADVLDVDWARRQDEMLDWYARLAGNRRRTLDCFESDYRGIEPVLRTLQGRVLDIGGGAGVTHKYLGPDVEYINVDPSAEWLSPEWFSIGGRLRSPAEPMAYVRGLGEQLPFRDSCFDVALSLWSLNHASRPDVVLHEGLRILRRGGRLLLVLEDMEPTWRDLCREPLRRRPGIAAKKLLSTVGNRTWPVQTDHTPITEAELMRWTGQGFGRRQRRWVGRRPAAYLLLEFYKRPAV